MWRSCNGVITPPIRPVVSPALADWARDTTAKIATHSTTYWAEPVEQPL